MSETAATAAKLSAEIAAAQNFSSGNITIALGNNITLSSDLEAINLAPGVTLTIEGNGHTLSGASKYEGFFVYQGHVDIDNLTITDAAAIGGGGGGGGAGLGGGLFVAGVNTISAGNTTTGGDVTLSNVSFTGDGAIGGAGGSGGGGGLGGSGGSGQTGGGGGIGNSAAGGGGKGIVVGAPGGGGGGNGNIGGGGGGVGGSSGGGGGNGNVGGGGGGVGGGAGGVFNPGGGNRTGGGGGDGGFGGGGGGAPGKGGAGGFGGGGGESANDRRGTGGFGGGGGGFTDGGGAAGGFGAGGGNRTGGGGLGAGGDIFVQQGGTLTIEGGTLGLGVVNGGTGATSGAGLGSAIFLQGNQTQILQAASGQTLTIAGVIADETGSDPTMPAGDGTGTGAGALFIEGPGTVEFTAHNTYTGGTTIDEGALDLAGRSSAGTGPISFAGPGGSLTFAIANSPTATITGFISGDTIDITDLHTPGITSFSFSNEILTISYIGDANTPLTLNLAETNFQSGDTFAYNRNASGGTFITNDIACFAAGTHIATAVGEMKVESLEIGDYVETLDGRLEKIKWIGQRSYDGRFIAGNKNILPIRIAKGAIADGVPSCDLFVSPGHAICIDGALIHAFRLVNGVSITQTSSVESVTYYHIETELHTVIFAENCPAETFLDENFRAQFQNADEYCALYPSQKAASTACLPQLEDGFALHTIQQRLNARAGISPPPQIHGTLRGYVDKPGPIFYSGWAQDVDNPETPVCLDIMVDDVCISSVLANLYRADLRQSGLGSGCHAFQATLPAGLTGRLEIRRAADGAELPWTEAALARAA